MGYKVYTDGGCSGNPGPGGWGFVLLKDDEFLLESSGGEKYTTNNKMEMTAVIEALSYLKDNGIDEAEIYADSQYVVNGITTWINGWKKNGWRTAGKQEVKNSDLWKEIDRLNSELSLTWIWVKGHAGIEWNERVDQLTQIEIARFQ